MIIKIETDNSMEETKALFMAIELIGFHARQNVRRWNFGMYQAKITQLSRAGNIFIHVSKAERAAA